MFKAEKKAKELIELFFNVNNDKLAIKDPTNPFISRRYAKKIAKIHVEQILTIDIDSKEREFYNDVLNHLL